MKKIDLIEMRSIEAGDRHGAHPSWNANYSERIINFNEKLKIKFTTTVFGLPVFYGIDYDGDILKFKWEPFTFASNVFKWVFGVGVDKNTID